MAATATGPGAGAAQPQVQGFDLLTVGAVASLAAGAIHATAAGMHSEHRQAVIAFVAIAAFQIAWGVLALVRTNLLIAMIGGIGNAAALSGWLMAKTNGISFVDGLEESEAVGFPDGLAAALAAVAVLASIAAILLPADRLRLAPVAGRALTGLVAVAGLALAVPGMVQTGSHSHAGGHGAGGDDHAAVADDDMDHDAAGHDDSATHTDGAEGEDGAHRAHTEGKPYDPALPIDLGGTEGVTPEHQAQAENLLALNLARLPQWADTATAEARGYHSIGDALTGEEHFVNWSYIDDDKILDPDFPESLVYKVDASGTRTLEAAMYMLPNGSTLETVPDIGGALMQWHIHNDLCFTTDPVAPTVSGITSENGPCPEGQQSFIPVPMIHIWIVPNECGPFAALEGVGAGQVAEGEERLCDHAHGSGSL